MEGVERARARVRELTPLIFSFDLPIVSSVDVNLDPNDPFLRAIQDQYNIQLMFRQKQKNFHTTMAVVKVTFIHVPIIGSYACSFTQPYGSLTT